MSSKCLNWFCLESKVLREFDMMIYSSSNSVKHNVEGIEMGLNEVLFISLRTNTIAIKRKNVVTKHLLNFIQSLSEYIF